MPRSASFELLPHTAPEDMFRRLWKATDVAWLDSSLRRPADGRYSIMACDPAWVFTAKRDQWELRRRHGECTSGRNGALRELDRLREESRVDPSSDHPALPFHTGAIGWLSYDLGRQFESLPESAENDLDPADIRFAWYDEALIWDHETHSLWRVSTRSDSATCTLDGFFAPPSGESYAASISADEVRSNFTRAEYMNAVEMVRDGIARGEYYQLNLVQRFTCRAAENPAETYLRLRSLNPAPFSAFLQTEEQAVLCSSPERFFHVSPDGILQACPIKGTRRRGNGTAEDDARRAELLGSAKERAELLMIVDLLRNDLGRVCTAGSVDVPRLHALESFATVHHLVGEVRGSLRPGTTREALLRAVFPGGSITGAPKISAMQAIERLEPHRRGIAMGSIGYFSAHGESDFNIAIRTAIVRQQRAYVSVGAGIVWDSDPAAEYAETLAKAEALFAALGVRSPQ